MTRRRTLLAVLLATVVGVWVMCFVSVNSPDYGRGLGVFDLGDGRQVRVWSQPHFGDPSSVWFEVSRDGRPLQPPRGLGRLDLGGYEVRTVWTADGSVSCTYAAGDPPKFAVLCDWAAGEVWPSGDDAAIPRWRERYDRLRAAHPELPPHRDFAPYNP